MFSNPGITSLSKLFALGVEHSYVKGEVVLSTDQEQKLCLIEHGFVKRYNILSNGSLGVQSIYGASDIFPLTYAFKILFDAKIYGGNESYYYEAMANTKMVTLDGQTLKDESLKDPMIYKDLLRVSGVRLQSNIQQLENLSLATFQNRVAHQLVFFARKFGRKIAGGIEICVPLTQQDLADLLGSTRETISLSMSTLREHGFITTGRYIIVHNIDELEELAFS